MIVLFFVFTSIFVFLGGFTLYISRKEKVKWPSILTTIFCWIIAYLLGYAGVVL